MELLILVGIGITAGALARKLMPGKDPQGYLCHSILGLVGGSIGGAIAMALGISPRAIGYVLGATGLLLVVRHYRVPHCPWLAKQQPTAKP